MLKRYGHALVTLLAAADLLTVVGAWLSAWALRFHTGFDYPQYIPLADFAALLPAVLVTHLVAYAGMGLYQPRRRQAVWLELGELVQAVGVAWLLTVGVIYFVREERLSRGTLLLFAGLNLTGLSVARVVARTVLHALRRRGYNLRHVAIVGAGPLGQALLARMRANPWTGLVPLFFVDDNHPGCRVHDLPVAGTTADLETLLETHALDEVYIALPQDRFDRVGAIIESLGRTTVSVRIVPDLAGFLAFHTNTSTFDGLPVISLQDSPLYGWGGVTKAVFDRLGAAVLLVVFAVPMVVIALAIRLTSRGPVLFRQVRTGLDGRPFAMYKFRTMRVDSDPPANAAGAAPDQTVGTSPGWTVRNDPRRTWLGAVLRQTSLDELPQFLNVLRGDMSLVGPRPERPIFISKFKTEFAPYMIRHKVRPGITGWAQINGWRGDTSIRKRLQYDLYYIRNWSLLFDIRILFETLLKGFVNKNAY